MVADPHQIARQHMVEGQLVPGNVMDEAIVNAMTAVARERFVPELLAGSAYVDEDVEVAPGRFLLAPLVLARMLQEAEIGPEDTVLDVGCATGYSSAILGRLAGKVVAVEEQMELAEQARQALSRQQLSNVEVVTGALAPGYPSAGPYDVVLVNGAVQVLPEILTDQLAEGGRLIVVQSVERKPGQAAGLGRLMVCRKCSGKLSSKAIADVSVPVLGGFEEKIGFVF